MEDYLKTIAPSHQIVPWGDPESIAMTLRELDVDIMITGHTHSLNVSTVDNRCIINPGSITGAYSPFKTDIVPSFCLLAITGNKCQIYVYSLKNGKLEVQRSEFVK